MSKQPPKQLSNKKTTPLKPLKILGMAGLLILVIIVLVVLIKPQLAKAPVAGKAVSYGAPTTGTVAGQWGLKVPTISAGAPWTVPATNEWRTDTIEVTGFVNFAQASKFSTLRLELVYDPTVLEIFSNNPKDAIIPLHPKYTTNLGSKIDPEKYEDQNLVAVLIYYTWSGSPGELSTFTMSGPTDLFKVKFRVTAPSPGAGQNREYESAVRLISVPLEVSNDDSGTNLGIYRILNPTELGIANVQMIESNARPSALTLTVYPGCEDVDEDGYVPAGKDKQACLQSLDQSLDDCNDNNAAVKPGATEVCNGIDDNCNSLTDASDTGIKKELNELPAGRTQLAGVCLNYKSCVNGALINSYSLPDSHYSGVDVDSGVDSVDSCDFWDNDCDGQLNEDEAASCKIGSPQAIGNVYLDFDQSNNPTAIQAVDTTDLTHLFILQQGYFAEELGAAFNTPVCNELGTGWVCICKSGDYYQTSDSAGTGVSLVNYMSGLKELLPDLLVQQSADGTVRLVDGTNNNVQVPCD